MTILPRSRGSHNIRFLLYLAAGLLLSPRHPRRRIWECGSLLRRASESVDCGVERERESNVRPFLPSDVSSVRAALVCTRTALTQSLSLSISVIYYRTLWFFLTNRHFSGSPLLRNPSPPIPPSSDLVWFVFGSTNPQIWGNRIESQLENSLKRFFLLPERQFAKMPQNW